MEFPASIKKLIEEFSKLPTVGPKTAERFVFYLLRKNNQELKALSEAILSLKNNIKLCQNCFSVSETNPCSLCTNPNRSKESICVVATYRDLLNVEKTKQYNGQYHILGGVINPIEGFTPDKLTIKQLINKVNNQNIKEVIIALNPNLEGETTTLYLNKTIKQINQKIKISRIARGLPIGSDLEYADEMTISNALKYRNEI